MKFSQYQLPEFMSSRALFDVQVYYFGVKIDGALEFKRKFS